MNVNKKWLKEENGDYIAPKTLTSCIQDENGNSFQEYADNMVVMSPEETTEVPEDLTSCISNQDMYNIVSDAYDSTKTYAVGDYCIYNNIAYKCTTAIDTAEEFDSAKWTATRIGTEVSELNNKLMWEEWQCITTDIGLDVWYRKNANICEIRVIGVTTKTITSTGINLGNLPVGYRPSEYLCHPYILNYYLRIFADGSLNFAHADKDADAGFSVRMFTAYGIN